MAINRINSKQLMSVLDESRDRISTLEDNIVAMKASVENRLAVVRNVQEYEQKQMAELTNLVDEGKWVEQMNKIILVRANVVEGIYDTFGSMIHPKLLKTPSNVFNFNTTTGYTFKDNAIVLMNDISKPKYKSMLMHDSIAGQDICFEEFDTSTVQIVVRVNPGNLLGTTEFNMLEIVPYLPGSFTITSCEVYSMQGYYMLEEKPETSMPVPIPNVGICRLMLDRNVNLYELRMTVTINYKNLNNKYPFGIKHLYFMKGDYNTNSYIVFKVTQNKYIDTISEDLIVYDQTGKVETTATEEQMISYISWDSGIGYDSIATTKGLTNNPLARDVKEFFVYYPIQRPTTSIQFDKIVLRS